MTPMQAMRNMPAKTYGAGMLAFVDIFGFITLLPFSLRG